MNLITKTTLFYLLVTLIVFGAGGIMSFNILRQEVDRETDYYLREQVNFLFEAIERGSSIESLNHSNLKVAVYDTINPVHAKSIYKDTLAQHHYTKKLEPHRLIIATKNIQGTWYRISLYESMMENDDISDSVFKSLSRIFGILVLLFIVVSLYISNWLFRPFRKTLKEIRNFKIQDDKEPDLHRTPVYEFTQLNAYIARMIKKIKSDYFNLRTFTENASHEIQTPIAVAKGKLELLIESEPLNEQQVQLIQSAYQSLDKLSKLNRSLALLSKIENEEFVNVSQVNLSQLAEKIILDSQELFNLKEIKLNKNIKPGVFKEMDSILADILLSNLIHNAIKHNIYHGVIEIGLNEQRLTISNTGNPLQVSPDQLFERFRKNSQSSQSLGLGLAIVKKICELNKMDVSYHYEYEWHTLSVELGESVSVSQQVVTRASDSV